MFTLVTWHLTDKNTDSFSISFFSSHGPFSYDIDHFIDHNKRYSRGASSQCKSPSATCVKSFCDTKSFILDLRLRDRVKIKFWVF